jgi:hypothetical protein
MLAVSETCQLFYNESKRVMLHDIRVEVGDRSVHDHGDTFASCRPSYGAVFGEDALLNEKFLGETQDKDLIRSISFCYQGRGRFTVREILESLVGYRRTSPHAGSVDLGDVEVKLLAYGITINWQRLSDFWSEIDGTEGIKISWDHLRVPVYHAKSLWFRFVEPDLQDPTFPAIEALGGLSSLAYTIVEDGDLAAHRFHEAAIIFHLRVLIHLLESFPLANALRELTLTITGDIAYSGSAVDSFCERFERLASRLAGTLHQDAFNGVQIRVEVRLQPSKLCVAMANEFDIPSVESPGGTRSTIDVQYDDAGIRVPHFFFRDKKLKVDRSFDVMHSLLVAARSQTSWAMTSSEMSVKCESRWRKRIQSDIRKARRQGVVH